EGRADLGIVTTGGTLPEGLEGRGWRQDRLLVVMAEKHPLAASASIRFDVVLDHPVVGVVESGALALLLEEQAQRRGRPMPYRFRVAGTDAGRRLVAAGHGISVMPEGVALPYEVALRLRCVPLAEPWALRRLRLVTRPAELLPAPARLLAAHLLRTEEPWGAEIERPPSANATRAK
ncbi:MAG TPA: LysR substrate-binding domain-containing protein, partial [Roseomonas sp.]